MPRNRTFNAYGNFHPETHQTYVNSDFALRGFTTKSTWRSSGKSRLNTKML